MQWLQDSNQSNVDNLNSVRYEAKLVDLGGGGGEKQEYLKAKIDELATIVRSKISETFIGASVILRRVPA
jgi:hypothetical protein